MTSTDKFALLRELAHLTRKYGPTVFSDLACFLRDPDTLAHLVTILEAAEAAGQRRHVTESRVGRTGAKGGKGNVQNLLSELAEDQPEKAQILSDFHEALAVKRALPTLRDLQSFTLDNGLRRLSATSRDKAVGPLLRDLATRPIEDIRSMLRRVKMEDTPGDRTLEGWTNVILDKDRTRGG